MAFNITRDGKRSRNSKNYNLEDFEPMFGYELRECKICSTAADRKPKYLSSTSRLRQFEKNPEILTIKHNQQSTVQGSISNINFASFEMLRKRGWRNYYSEAL